MTTPNPPAVGATGWGTPLNAYLQGTLQVIAQTAAASIASHVSAAPVTATLADPHGDRAYASSLVQAFTSGANLANGFVQLTSAAAIPSALLPTLSGLGGLGLLATTTQAGTAYNATTQTILTWSAPTDTLMHRVMLLADLNITSLLTGGGVQISYTSPANTITTKPVFAQTAVGEYVISPMTFLIKSGSTVTVSQSAVMSAGAATVYAELWGL